MPYVGIITGVSCGRVEYDQILKKLSVELCKTFYFVLEYAVSI